MKFRTEVAFPPSEVRLDLEDRIMALGSCFATEMSQLFSQAQMQTLCNPFGTLFNPFSVSTALQRLHKAAFYTEEDLLGFNAQAISLDHHSSFNSQFPHQTLEKINTALEAGNTFLQQSRWVIITYGSAFVYEFLPRNRYVANCHKIPSKYFKKHLLSPADIADLISQTITALQDICRPDVQILFSVSPVRHLRDGITENMLSKAHLLTGLHEAISQFQRCTYLPIYEMMMDDLRDYRFYREDMVHPTAQAIQYIWNKFSHAYFSPETQNFVGENLKIKKALEHVPADRTSTHYLEFVKTVEARILAQQQKVRHKIF